MLLKFRQNIWHFVRQFVWGIEENISTKRHLKSINPRGPSPKRPFEIYELKRHQWKLDQKRHFDKKELDPEDGRLQNEKPKKHLKNGLNLKDVYLKNENQPQGQNKQRGGYYKDHLHEQTSCLRKYKKIGGYNKGTTLTKRPQLWNSIGITQLPRRGASMPTLEDPLSTTWGTSDRGHTLLQHSLFEAMDDPLQFDASLRAFKEECAEVAFSFSPIQKSNALYLGIIQFAHSMASFETK